MRRVLILQFTGLILLGLLLLAIFQPELTHSKSIDSLPAELNQPTAIMAQALSDPEVTRIPLTQPTTTAPALANPPQEGFIPQTGGSDPSLASPTLQPAPTEIPVLDPVDWKTWPVLPSVSPKLREIYLAGLEQGNNPRAFSILGDCQSQPDVFLGILDNNPSTVRALSDELQETIAQFSGSFDRYSPTVKDGTTEGALLWAQWNDNKEKKCDPGETPLDCELRVHQPSIVFIHVGTHYEDRNRRYMVTIIEKILAKNAIPVFVTKADNREQDERVNLLIASLASEYNLPLWNFWASVQHLPNQGLMVDDPIYLNEEGVKVHRLGGIEALDAVWKALR